MTIRNFFLGGDFAVDRVEFASGGLISADQFFGIFGATNPDPIDSPAFENLPDEGFFGTVFVGDASDQIIIGSSDADFINAGSGNDDISGGANADYLIGGRGIDTFRFGFGDGIDTLNLFDGSNIAQDILQFEEGITLSNLGAERVGDNLRLVLTGGQDQIFVRDYFNTSGANFALASILFSDGSSLSESQLQVLVDAGIQLNVGPAAVSDSVVGREDETLVIDVAELLVNDSDGNGDVLSITAVSNALNGSVTLDSVAQTISFVPDANYNGAASFDYTVSDGTLESVASVAIDIAAVNDAPAAVADSATVEQDTAITLNVADVLLNDRDIEGDALTITAVANALNGTVVLDSVAETITFTPDADYFGPASFDYTVSDGQASDTGTVNLTVNEELNVGPAAVSDSVVGREDETLVIDVAELLVNDSDGNGDVLSITAVSNALNGSVTLDSVAQTISFVPDANYNGAASFDYTVSDGTLESVASVAIDIAAVNDAPAAVADSATVEQDTAITLNVADVLLNDRDIEGDALTITAVANALNGTVVLDSVAETITFTPDADYFGPASFDYTVSDGQASDTGTVNLTVNEELNVGPGSISVSVDTTSATNVEAANFDLSVLSGGATVSYAINGGAGGFSQDGAGVDGGASELLNAGESLRISFDPQVSPNGIDNVVLTLSDFESGNADAVTLTVTHDSDNEGTSQLSVVQVFAQDANSSEQIDLSQFSGVTQIDIANASGFEVGLLNVSYEEPVPGQAGVNSFEASATISGDILIGSQGNDQLEGGDGNDELFFAAGDGQDTIDAQDDPVLVDSQETLRLEGITQDELWFSRTGDNLLIDVIGNDDQVTVNNDFLSEEFQINTLVTGDSVVSNGQIDQLVAAMSVFHIQDGGSEVSSLSVQDEQQPMIAVGS